MSYDEFLVLVLNMRDAQREYFRTRDSGVLGHARALERQVDAAIKAASDKQSRLF